LQPQLKTSLQNSEVVIAPPVKEVSKLLSAYIKNVAESAREFVRWMDGTCLEMPDQRAKGDTDGDPVVMHFSSEVLRMQQVKFRSDLSLLQAELRLHCNISRHAPKARVYVHRHNDYGAPHDMLMCTYVYVVCR
jgi:hypothetical protein